LESGFRISESADASQPWKPLLEMHSEVRLVSEVKELQSWKAGGFPVVSPSPQTNAMERSFSKVS
jgi:hypothetical protein